MRHYYTHTPTLTSEPLQLAKAMELRSYVERQKAIRKQQRDQLLADPEFRKFLLLSCILVVLIITIIFFIP